MSPREKNVQVSSLYSTNTHTCKITFHFRQSSLDLPAPVIPRQPVDLRDGRGWLRWLFSFQQDLGQLVIAIN